METTKTITANSRLGVYVKQMDAQDRTTIFAAANKFIRAKRTCGNVAAAYSELYNTLVSVADKYDFTLWGPDSNVQELIEEFAARVEIGTRVVTGDSAYTCRFASVEQANTWLACQKDIEIKNLQIQTKGAGNKVCVITIDYVVTSCPTNAIYQFEENKKTRFFFKSNHKKFNQKWQKQHPDFNFVSSVKRDWGFRLIGGSVGYFRLIIEKYVVLYTYKVK